MIVSSTFRVINKLRQERNGKGSLTRKSGAIAARLTGHEPPRLPRGVSPAKSVQRCMAEGLVGGEGFAVDASMIKAEANRQRSVPGSQWQAPETASHAVREYLAVLDDAAFAAATPVVPKFVSPADPAARWTGDNGGLAFFAYCTNYLIDLKRAVIVDVEATTAVRQAEVTAAAADDRSYEGALRSLASAVGGRRRLRFG